MASPVGFAALTDFVFANILYFVIGGVGLFFILNYLKFGTRKKIKVVNIADIERMKFIERMKNNKPALFKSFYRGDTQLVGKIIAMRDLPIKNKDYKANSKSVPKQVSVLQLLVKPMLIAKLGITRPFSKLLPFQINYNVVRFDKYSKSLQVPEWTTFDYFMGIYYDSSIPEEVHKNIIIDHNLFRSTAQQVASVFFSKSQEQSTFDPDHAHALAMKEKELQIEMAKKKGNITSI